jgi:hypothetical protein
MAALAAQARVGIGTDMSRYQGGLVGKLWIEPGKLLILAEGDFIRQQVTAASPAFGQNQFVSYSGLSFFPVQGLMLSAAYERYQENLAVRGTGVNAIDGQINFFPYAHCELLFLYRMQMMGDQPLATLAMLQLHYYM